MVKYSQIFQIFSHNTHYKQTVKHLDEFAMGIDDSLLLLLHVIHNFVKLKQFGRQLVNLRLTMRPHTLNVIDIRLNRQFPKFPLFFTNWVSWSFLQQ